MQYALLGSLNDKSYNQRADFASRIFGNNLNLHSFWIRPQEQD